MNLLRFMFFNDMKSNSFSNLNFYFCAYLIFGLYLIHKKQKLVDYSKLYELQRYHGLEPSPRICNSSSTMLASNITLICCNVTIVSFCSLFCTFNSAISCFWFPLTSESPPIWLSKWRIFFQVIQYSGLRFSCPGSNFVQTMRLFYFPFCL